MARRNKAAGAGSRPLRPGSGQARIIPNKNRRLQIAPTRRKLFSRKAKDEFLEWFGATCNASLSARKVGFNYRTAFRHRREDPVFGAEWEEVLRLGYGRLEEVALREAERALTPRRRRRSKGAGAEAAGMSVVMTPQDALQLLREHKRGLAGIAKPGRAPTVASNNEVFAALVKRLKAFQVRVREEDAARAVEADPSTGLGTGEGEGEGSDGAAPSTIRSADGPESGRSSPRDDLGLPGAIRPDSPRPGEDQEGPSPASPGKPGEDLEEPGA
jgi:hypothetical protein